MNNNQNNNNTTIWSFIPSSVATVDDYTAGGGHPHQQVISVSVASSSSTSVVASSPFHYNNQQNFSANTGAGNNNGGALELISPATESASRDFAHHHHNHHAHNNSQQILQQQQQIYNRGINTSRLHENESSPFLPNTPSRLCGAGGGGSSFLYDYMVHQPPLPLDASDANFLRSPNFSATGLSAAYAFPTDTTHWPGFSSQEFAETFIVDGTLSSFIPTGEFMPHALGPTNPFVCTGRFVPPFADSMGPTPPKRRTGGRRPKEEECKLPPEEEEKRRLRRQRNKEAAARCRKRRLDQMTTLEVKVNELQSHQSNLETQLDRLIQEKQELEFILKSHEAICQCRGDIKSFTVGQSLKDYVVKSDPDEDDMDDMDDDEEKSSDPTLSSAAVVVVSMGNGCGQGGGKSVKDLLADVAAGGGLLSRPSTLPLPSDLPIMTPTFDQTPSRAMFNLFDQPTGLTPMTSGGGFTPLLAVTSAMTGLETPSVTESNKTLLANNSFTKL